MKIINKLLMLLCLFVVSNSIVHAQIGTLVISKKNIQVKGNFIIQGYTGLSYVTSLLRYHPITHVIDIKQNIITGITTEYIVSDGKFPFGIAAEVGYDYYAINYNYFDNKNNPVKFSSVSSVLRLLLRLHIHLIEKEKWDFYLIGGSGTLMANNKLSDGRTLKFMSNYPFYPQQTSSQLILKTGIGIRYFPHKNFGAHAEITLGTPFLQAGICYKLK